MQCNQLLIKPFSLQAHPSISLLLPVWHMLQGALKWFLYPPVLRHRTSVDIYCDFYMFDRKFLVLSMNIPHSCFAFAALVWHEFLLSAVFIVDSFFCHERAPRDGQPRAMAWQHWQNVRVVNLLRALIWTMFVTKLSVIINSNQKNWHLFEQKK